MNEEKLAVGTWGGRGIRFTVGKSETYIEFDCARGKIRQPITHDAQGKFSAQGTYLTEKGGAAIPDGELEEHNGKPNSTFEDEKVVVYEGFVKGRQMTLTVKIIKSEEILGRYELVFNRDAELTKCY